MLTSNMTRSAIAVLLCALSASANAVADNTAKHPINIAAQDLGAALDQLSRQAGTDLVYRPEQVRGLKTRGAVGDLTAQEAVVKLLRGTRLTVSADATGALLIAAPQAGVLPTATSAAGTPADQSTDRSSLQPAQATPQQSSAPVPVGGADQREASKNRSDKETLQEVVVTGTNIHGVGPGVSAVITLGRSDIERSGVGSTGDALALLPQNFGGGPSPTNFFAPTPGTTLNLSAGSGIDLRGLGPGATLTLVNGMRVAPSGFGTFVDVSSIPLTAIDRIEVLPDGASAIYGSDAVAGVVNIILRSNYDGAETRVRYGSVTQGSQHDIRAGQTFGKAWDQGHAMISYEYQDSSALSVTDRAFSGAAEVPGDIIPAARRNSVFASGSERFGGNVETFGHALFTQRVSSQITTFAGETDFRNAIAYLYTASGGVRMMTAQDWNVQLDGEWASSREDERQGVVGDSTNGPPSFATRDDLWSAELRADGPVIALPGGSARAAVGTEYRHERYAGTAFTRTGNDNLNRNVKAAFAEILVPIVGEANGVPAIRRLTLSAAVRYEDYSDFGVSTNPKVGLLWQPISALTLRATWGRSFNAPRLQQLSPYNNFGELGTITQYGGPFPSPFTNPSDLVLTDVSTNPHLGPERSKNWTAGIEFSPAEVPHLKTSLTYFSYDYTNRIAYVAQNTLPVFTNNAAYADYTILNPSIALSNSIISSYLPGAFANFTGAPFNPATTALFAILRLGTTNLATERQTGLDISASYAQPAFNGQLSVAFNAQRLLRFTNQVGTTTLTAVDLLNTIYNPADLKLRGTVAWARGGLDVAASVNYTGSYLDNADTPSVDISSWTTVDARVAWKFPDESRGALLRNTTLSFSVQNVFDREPPRVSTLNPFNALGYDPTNANPLGRFVAAEIQKEW